MQARIILEQQDKTIYLWVNHEVIKSWKRQYTGPAGAPMKLAKQLESAFSIVGVPVTIEYGDGFEELNTENMNE